jgi:hypothetical protein
VFIDRHAVSLTTRSIPNSQGPNVIQRSTDWTSPRSPLPNTLLPTQTPSPSFVPFPPENRIHQRVTLSTTPDIIIQNLADEDRNGPFANDNAELSDNDEDEELIDRLEEEWVEERESSMGRQSSQASMDLPRLPAKLFHSTIFSNHKADPTRASADHHSTDHHSAEYSQETYQHRLELAADYITDALHGRPLQITPTTLSQKYAQLVYSHFLYNILVFLVPVAHMAMALWEDPNDSCNDSWTITYLELSFDSFYVFDVLLGLISLGASRFFSKKFNIGRGLIAIFMFATYHFCDVYGRSLRPLYLIARSTPLRHTIIR